MRRRKTPAPSLVLDPQPFARRTRAWHALAALRTKFHRPALQLFGSRASTIDEGSATRAQVNVPEHLLAPQRSLLD